MADKKRIIVGMAGNPNVGKSAIFNALTGGHQHVGNWPGKTIERAEGNFAKDDHDIHLVDLPGTYSLAAQSLEEVVARDYIISGEPDVILNVVDATCLERNLNLTLQIMELTDRVVVAVNLMDQLRRQGSEIDLDKLAQALGVPVIATVAVEGEGLAELVQAIVEMATNQPAKPVAVDYGITVQGYAKKLEEELAELGIRNRKHWIALRLLENDPEIVKAFKEGHLKIDKDLHLSTKVLEKIVREAARLRESIRPDARIEIVRRRYERAHDIFHHVMCTVQPVGHSSTERLDRLVLHRIWSWPILLGIIVIVLWATIKGANVPSDLLATGFTWLADASRRFLVNQQAPWWLVGALVDGLIVGTGTVIAVMLPPMILFFTAFNLMEDIGFIPRIAFILDRLMRAVGSQGKHTLVALMSFGCNVTGVLSSRIIENPKDRIIAIVTSPLIICNGRFGAGLALIILFFGDRALLITLIYLAMSVAAMLLATGLLNRLFFHHEPGGFVMELPPYRTPKWGQVIWRTLAHQVGHTMGRAVMIAAPATFIIWLLGNLPTGVPFERTAVGRLVFALDPLGKPLGLTGEMLTALLFTLAAKEIVVSSLAMTYGLQTTLIDSRAILDYLAQSWSSLTAFSFITFFMLYLPCLVTVWATWKETRQLKWIAMSLLLPLVIASSITWIIYQVGSAFGF
ncbi:ferrous iron transport protein B [candidate division KSB1 bacterium]|nr:ferrous iron transport protein B [candidate division KSB1 bacterium]